MSQTPTRMPGGASRAPSVMPAASMQPSNARHVASANPASKAPSSIPLQGQDDETQDSSTAIPTQSKFRDTTAMRTQMPTQSRFRAGPGSIIPTQSKFRDYTISVMPAQSKFRDATMVPGSMIPTSSKFRDSTQVPASIVPGGSILDGEYDMMMAERQTRIPTLAPKERAEQEEWAQKKLELGGSCYDGADWVRVDEDGGYKCSAGRHWVSDELLGEGKGGWYLLLKKHDLSSKKGHYYGNPMKEPWAVTRHGEKFKIENNAIIMLKDN